MLRVWVEAPADLRLERGLARDGADAREHWLSVDGRRGRALRPRAHPRARADVRLDAFGARWYRGRDAEPRTPYGRMGA